MLYVRIALQWLAAGARLQTFAQLKKRTSQRGPRRKLRDEVFFCDPKKNPKIRPTITVRSPPLLRSLSLKPRVKVHLALAS